MFESVEPMLEEHKELQEQLADPAVHADASKAKKLGRRYAQLSGIVENYQTWKTLGDDIDAAQELAAEDPSFASEIKTMQKSREEISEKLHNLLIPRDPDDGRNVILEIKAGAGGDEAALFAADLYRMYIRYAEKRGWKHEIIELNESDLGGFKDVQVAIKGNSNDSTEGVWASLKFEGGVHRVQRIPATETQGRIHTSAAGVLALPEVDEPEEIEINNNDLKIDVYRSSGPGGQSVNTTDSAVRITHLPTGIVVAMQNEKSQLQNKEAAMRVLRARLLAYEQEKIDEENSAARRSQVSSMDRSERIRTYNYPENRISDHRTGYKAYNLETVMNGDLQAVINSAIELDEAERMKNLEQEK